MARRQLRDTEEMLGWCLRDTCLNEWWYLTEVLGQGVIRAINERGLYWQAQPLVFKRVNADGRGHDAKQQAPRYAQAHMGRHGDWVVPRLERGAQRFELVMVPHRSLVTEPEPLETVRQTYPTKRRDHPLIPTATVAPNQPVDNEPVYKAIVLY